MPSDEHSGTEHKSEPKVSVHGIPKSQYDKGTENPSAGEQSGQNEGGITGHLKRNWPIYAIVLGIITIIVIIMFSNNNNQSGAGTTTDQYGYGTGNSNPSDLYGSQLDSDYAQMINATNETNALLQQLLNGQAPTGSKGGGSSGGGSGGKKGGGGSSHGKGKGHTGGKSGGGTPGKKTHHGSGAGGKVTSTHKGSGSHGSTQKVTMHSGSKTVSKHAVSTGHQSGKTSITPHNTHGSHGWIYTVKKGDTLSILQSRFFPGSNGSNAQGNLMQYGNNSQIIRSQPSWAKRGLLKPGTRILA